MNAFTIDTSCWPHRRYDERGEVIPYRQSANRVRRAAFAAAQLALLPEEKRRPAAMKGPAD